MIALESERLRLRELAPDDLACRTQNGAGLAFARYLGFQPIGKTHTRLARGEQPITVFERALAEQDRVR